MSPISKILNWYSSFVFLWAIHLVRLDALTEVGMRVLGRSSSIFDIFKNVGIALSPSPIASNINSISMSRLILSKS